MTDMLTDKQDAPTSFIPAHHLGFATVGELMREHMESLAPADREQFQVDLMRQKALVRVETLTELQYYRAIDPAATGKTLSDAVETNLKISGIVNKQAIKDLVAGVTININIPQLAPEDMVKTIHIEKDEEDATFTMKVSETEERSDDGGAA